MIRFALVILFMVSLLLYPSVGAGQEGIEIAPGEPKIDFPDSITFPVEAKAPDEITRIILEYTVDRMSCAPVTSQASPEFSPAPQVKASWTWNMKKTGSLPPGALIEYSWVVEGAAGHQTRTPPGTLTFEDNRHTWQQISGEGMTLFWYRGDEAFARSLLDTAAQTLDKLARDTGVRPTRPIKIYIYGSSGDLRGALVYSQEWTGGLAFTGYGIVAIGIAPTNLSWGKRATAHELAHLVIGELTFNCYGDLPTWLSEGLAAYAEGSMQSGFQRALEDAVAQDRLISVRSLSASFPANPSQARLAYAESYSLVDYLVNQHGSDKMLALLKTFIQGTTYANALKSAYGFDTQGLEGLWRQSLGLSPQAPQVTPTPTPTLLPTLVPYGITPPAVIPTPTPLFPNPTPTIIPKPSPPPTPTLAPTPAPRRAGLACRQTASGGDSVTNLASLAFLLVLPGAEITWRRWGRRKD